MANLLSSLSKLLGAGVGQLGYAAGLKQRPVPYMPPISPLGVQWGQQPPPHEQVPAPRGFPINMNNSPNRVNWISKPRSFPERAVFVNDSIGAPYGDLTFAAPKLPKMGPIYDRPLPGAQPIAIPLLNVRPRNTNERFSS